VRTVAFVAVAGVAVLGAASTPVVSTLPLPSSANFFVVESLGDRLLLSGFDTRGGGCRWLVVSPESLRVQSSLHANCERPPIATDSIVPVEFPAAGNNQSQARIARPNPNPSRVSYGPVVMTFTNVSDTHLEWTYGPGSLWIYDVATRHGAEVLDVSTATGRVVRTVSMPKLYRPLLAADADGLWVAASPETSAGTPAPLYNVAPDAHAARLVHSGGYAAFWLLAAGHTVWADIASMTPRRSTVRQEIWRFSGPSATAHALASADNLNPSTTPAVQPGSAALWTINSVPLNSTYDSCIDHQIVRIDARTGHQTVITTLDLPGNPCFPADNTGGVAFVGGTLYFLANDSTPALYRVQP
jgi:hypothetical protein